MNIIAIHTFVISARFIRGFNIGEFEYQNMSDGEAEAGVSRARVVGPPSPSLTSDASDYNENNGLLPRTEPEQVRITCTCRCFRRAGARARVVSTCTCECQPASDRCLHGTVVTCELLWNGLLYEAAGSSV